MFQRNRSKLLSVSLVGTALATALMAQGAAAVADADHAVADVDRDDGDTIVVEREGPRGEIVVRREGEGRETVAGIRGGRVGPLPTLRSN